MKKLLTTKYIALSFVIVIVSAAFSRQASAQEVYYYKCADGGSITTTVNITKNFFKPSEGALSLLFEARSQLYSTCPKTFVNVKATNNDTIDNPQKIIIDNTEIHPTETLPVRLAYKEFTAPTKPGTYTVGFETGVEPLCFSNRKELFSESNVYHMYPEMMIDTGQSTGLVTLSYEAIEVPNRFTVWSFAGNQIIAASGINPTDIKTANITYNPAENKGDGRDGWIGHAEYPGPWNRNPQEVNSTTPYDNKGQGGYRGTMTFTPTAGQSLYRVRIETQTGPGSAGFSDDYFIEAQCS